MLREVDSLQSRVERAKDNAETLRTQRSAETKYEIRNSKYGIRRAMRRNSGFVGQRERRNIGLGLLDDASLIT